MYIGRCWKLVIVSWTGLLVSVSRLLEPRAKRAQAFVEEARVVRPMVEHDAVGRRLVHQAPAAIDVQAVRPPRFDELLRRLRTEVGDLGDVWSGERAHGHACCPSSRKCRRPRRARCTDLRSRCTTRWPPDPCMVHSRVMPHALPSRTASRSASVLPVSMCWRSMTYGAVCFGSCLEDDLPARAVPLVELGVVLHREL